MKTSDFNYELPPELIAQIPTEPRDACRLLLVNRNSSEFEHRRFIDLPAILRPSDLLVFNNTRVIPARLIGRKTTGGHVEALLIRRVDRAREQGRRVIAIGTTTVRALESVADPTGRIVSTSGNGG